MTRTLTVNVNRNPNAPIFTGSRTVTINDDTAVGTTVLRLSATDGDNDIVTFSKVDVSDVQGGNFFVVSNGDIVLVNALSGQASYTVSL